MSDRIWKLAEIQGTSPLHHGLREEHLWFASREEAVRATEAIIDAVVLVKDGWAARRSTATRRARVNYKIVEYRATRELDGRHILPAPEGSCE